MAGTLDTVLPCSSARSQEIRDWLNTKFQPWDHGFWLVIDQLKWASLSLNLSYVPVFVLKERIIDQILLHQSTYECTIVWPSFWNFSQI